MNVSRRLGFGISYGVGFAAVYSVVAALVWAASRGHEPEPTVRELVAVIVTYWIGGVLGGAVVGALLPRARSLGGAAGIGFLAALPFFYAVGMASYPPSEWFGHVPLVAFGTALFLGPACGIGIWIVNRRDRWRRR